jgi:hypothetical protein
MDKTGRKSSNVVDLRNPSFPVKFAHNADTFVRTFNPRGLKIMIGGALTTPEKATQGVRAVNTRVAKKFSK